MEAQEDVRKFLGQDESGAEEGRKDSNLANFARKMSSIVMGEPGTLRHRRRHRRSPRQVKSRNKSRSPLRAGQKLHIDVSKGGIFFSKRKKTFCESLMSTGSFEIKRQLYPVMIFWLIEGLKKIQTMFGVAVTEEDTEGEDEEVEANPMRQLQDLCAPHRHRPSSLEALVRETGSVWSMMQTSSEVLRNTLTVSLGTS